VGQEKEWQQFSYIVAQYPWMKGYSQGNQLLGKLGRFPQQVCKDFEDEYGQGFEPDGWDDVQRFIL
jgi:hypothetical protein